ncbi:MAG: fatty acyl-AMP ligase [Actinomycetia bacterium]|nr:fatty acyl-AMP ligase [Actinomycetes bacterium]
MQTIAERMVAAAKGDGTVTFINGDERNTISYGDLHHNARVAAAALQARQVGPGSHVALLGPTTERIVTTIQASWLVGATLVLLPLPMRLASIEEFVGQTRRRVHNADVDLLVVDDDLAPFIEAQPDDPPMVLLSAITSGEGGIESSDFLAPEYDPDSLAFLQFTSGSTSEPKGVMLPNRTVTANLDAIAETTNLDAADDVMVSWLPLYHDMGLVGFCILPLTTGTPLVLGAPQDFLAKPARWMQWISEYGGTATAGPNFSWVLATRALRRNDQLDLSALRVALNGAEPVDPNTVESFIEAGERHGLEPGAVFPAFGMAETTIAGTFPEPGAGLRTDTVNGPLLEREHLAAPVDADDPSARRLVKLGKPVPGLEIRIVDPATGHQLAEREVGELEVRGTSVTPGYYKRDDANAESFRDDWFRTGDLAYIVDGDMVMCGRIKDVIIVGGRNVYPQDIERVVGEVDGIRPGNVIAFGIDGRQGKQSVVVVAEAKDSEPEAVRSEVADRVVRAVGLPAKDVVLVPTGTLPKTSSGKLQRSLCKDRYLGAELERLS